MGERPLSLGRRNRAAEHEELWRPPPFPSRAAVAPRRGGRLAAAFRRVFDLQAATLWLDLTLLLPRLEGTVLDVGCGAQPYRSLLAPGTRYIGIDTAEARSRFGYAEPDTLYSSGETWPVADGSADAVLATETLEHVPDAACFLAEAARCLRAGGLLILTVPFAARYHFIPHDYWRFTPAALMQHLEAAGFAEIAVHARGTPVTVACYKLMALTPLLFFPARRGVARRWLLRLLGAVTLPLFLLAALTGRFTLSQDWGDDCLGYTVLARRPEA